jgi:hypothetical protein
MRDCVQLIYLVPCCGPPHAGGPSPARCCATPGAMHSGRKLNLSVAQRV